MNRWRSRGKNCPNCPRGLTKTFFGNGGAEAIEGGKKLARLYTGKHEFIALHASFHGRSWGTLSVTGNIGRKKRGGPYAAGVTFAPAPYVYRSQWPNDPEECGRQCAKAIEDVIRFTTGRRRRIHCRTGHGRRRNPGSSTKLLQGSEKGSRPHGILFIADEVIPGFPAPERCLPSSITALTLTFGHCKRHCRWFPAKRIYHPSRNCGPTSPEIISRPSEEIRFLALPRWPTSSLWSGKSSRLALPRLAIMPSRSWENCRSRIHSLVKCGAWTDDSE